MAFGAARVVAWSKYKKVKVVGAGGSGQVFLVEPIAPGEGSAREKQLLVAKRVYVDDSDEHAQCAAVEARILHDLPTHCNIVALVEHFFDDEGYFNLIEEYCSCGDLERLISDRTARCEPLSLRDVAFLTFQILCGVRHLHRNNVVHRDVKPGNIFLVPGAPGAVGHDHDDDGRVDPCQVTVKVADFGISRVMRTGSYATTVVGTPFYLAPEICESRPYAASADMWALGCIVFEMCSMTKLFGGSNMLAVVRAISAGVVPALPAAYAVLDPLVRELVVADAGARLTATEAIDRYFVAKLPAHVTGVAEYNEDEGKAPVGPRAAAKPVEL